MSSEPTIKFSDDQKQRLVQKIKMYFREELDQDIGQFDAEFLLDFLAEEIGVSAYNQALYDVQAFIRDKFEHLEDELFNLEKPLP